MTKIPIAKPFIDENDIKGVVNVLKSGRLSLGPKLKEFEDRMAKYLKVKYACAVSSGTAGLHIVVRAMGLKKGDEVITSPFSFIASSNCLLYEGVKPTFVDIEKTTFNLNPDNIQKTITNRTKAILVVHVFGQSANMIKIMKIAKKHNLRIIEDACESIGSTYHRRMTGTMGNMGVFAFYPNKQMTTGEGGMIITNSQKIYKLALSLRNQGRDIEDEWLIHKRLGYNYRMDEMSASLGITQLKKLDSMINEKRKIASLYDKYLANIPGIILPKIGKNQTCSWFVYVIRIINGKRNFILQELQKKGVQTRPYLPVLHLQPFMKKQFGYKKGDFPVAEKISSQTLALPFYIGLTEKNISYIAKAIKKLI